jgi:flagellar hook-length control protein FliK
VSIAVNTGAPRGGAVATPVVGAPIVQAAPTPADKPATAGAQPPANRFAELLRRSRAEAPKPAPQVPAPAPAAPAAHGEAADSGEATDPSSIESKAAPSNAAKARAALPKGTTGKAAVAAADRPAEDAHDRTDHDDEGGEPGTSTAAANADRIDPRVAVDRTIEAARSAGRTGAGAPDDATDSGAADAGASPGKHGASRRSDGPLRGQVTVDAATGRRSLLLTDASRDPTMSAAGGTSFPALLAEAGQAPDGPGAAPAHGRPIDALSASFAAAAATRAAELPGPTATSTLSLPTPIDAPDFAAALGVQVSMLVKDGVQQAELHLNPAEMGPVSIHISLDGTAARVDFGADVAATRAAIERGLPELASALRDAGFTLAGGGVSQHAGSRSSGEDDGARSSGRLDAGGTAAAAPIAAQPMRVGGRNAAGGVDLYA